MMTPARFEELAEEVRRDNGIDHELPSIAQMIDAIMEDSDDRHEWGGELLRSMLECMKHLPHRGGVVNRQDLWASRRQGH